jgi:steroid delta-isomerase-like uncharacterized protein
MAAKMTKAQHHAIADELFKAWNDHDVQGILEHMTDDVVYMDPTIEKSAKGKEAVRAHLEDNFIALPDLRFDPEDFHVYVADDESSSIATWTLKGTNTGPSKETGLPATGKEVTISGTVLSRFRDGKISEYAIVYDGLDFMQQIGALPRTDGIGFKALVMFDVMAGKAADQAGKATQRAVKVIRR